MEHIPNIKNPVYPHITVPYLFDERYPYVYDNKGFDGFPERSGWESELFLGELTLYDGVEASARVASFLQAWLYFGLMSEVFQTPINTDGFIRCEDGIKVITTAKLQDYINAWQDRALVASDEENNARISKLDHFLRANFIYFDVCIGDDPTKRPRSSPVPVPGEVQLSIAVLFATLCMAKLHIFPSSNYSPFGHSNQLIINRLKNDGWCGSDIALLCEGAFGTSSALDLYHASLLGPRQDRKDHSKCLDTICVAYQVDDKLYETKHRAKCNGCSFVDVPSEKLAAVIARGHIPLVSVEKVNGDAATLRLNISEVSPDVTYIAISHVYADGLGNRHASGLPHCQLELLQQRVNELYNHSWDSLHDAAGPDSIPFWMDTLCIPVLRRFKWHRALAITRMAETYERAGHVLVLNGELELASRDAPPEEVFRRITRSNWFRRLWTLQEGVLARDLHFQFGDGALDIGPLVHETQVPLATRGEVVKNRFSVAEKLRTEASNPYIRLCTFQSIPPRERIRALYGIVEWRATTYARDEPVCFGTLLGLNTKPIVDAEDEERMPAFILSQRYFPVQALFLTEPRLGKPGYGWYLLQFLRRINPEAIKPESPLCVADQAGLHVSLAGFKFDPSGFPIVVGGSEFKLDFKFCNRDEDTWYRVGPGFWLADRERPGSWKEILDRYGVKELAIILEEWEPKPKPPAGHPQGIQALIGPPNFEDELMASLLNFDDSFEINLISDLRKLRAPSPTRGALVAVMGNGGEEISARFCGVVMVAESVKQSELPGSRLEPVVVGSVLGCDQKWCVG